MIRKGQWAIGRIEQPVQGNVGHRCRFESKGKANTEDRFARLGLT